MSSVFNPSNDEYIINGSVIVKSRSPLAGKLRIDNVSDLDLNNLPANFDEADSALTINGGAFIGGNLYVAGSIVSNGDVITLGNTDDEIAFNGNIASDLLPSTDGINLGSNTQQWQSVNVKVLNLSSATTDIGSTDANGLRHVNTSTSAAISLADGEEGEVRTVLCTETLTTPVVVTPVNSAGFTSFALTNEGDSVTIIFSNSKWFITNSFRASII